MPPERKLSEASETVFTDAMRLLYEALDTSDPTQRRRLMTDAVLAALSHGDARAARQIEALENEVATLRSRVAILQSEIRELREANRKLRGGR